MAWIGHNHFRSSAHGRRGDNKILESPQFFNDQNIHDDAGNDAAQVSDDRQKYHEPWNGWPSFKGRGSRRLTGGSPAFGRKELHRSRDDFFAGKARLFV